VRRRHVMGYSIDPGLQAAAAVKQTEAAPKFNVDLLQQVAPLFRVSLVAPGEPAEGGSTESAGLLVQLVVSIH
jgi:hypothetical protein